MRTQSAESPRRSRNFLPSLLLLTAPVAPRLHRGRPHGITAVATICELLADTAWMRQPRQAHRVPRRVSTLCRISKNRETRARSVRWFRQETRWRRSDPWMTSIVDLDTTHSGGIIGLAPGRSGACVQAWMSLQTKEFRDGVKVVAIDPSAPYASGIRRVLPQARIVLDHFHLVLLACMHRSGSG